ILPSTAKARGLRFYFTGERCLHGHVAKRITDDGNCVECRREIQLRYDESSKGRKTQRRWRESRKGYSTKRRYHESKKGRATQRKYERSRKVRARRRSRP